MHGQKIKLALQLSGLNILRNALKEEEFYLAYQPFMDLPDERMVGAEALLRWKSKSFGILFPHEFMAYIKQFKMSIPIGYRILHKACQQLKIWQTQGFENIIMSVNISREVLCLYDFPEYLESLIVQTGIDSRKLQFEISESFVVDNGAEAIKTLNLIKELGIRLAIDNFGSGYANLNCLKSLPVDLIKIAQRYVQELKNSHGDAPIARAIIHFGHAMGIKVLATGVETDLQHRFMVENNCDFAQGFYYYTPAKAKDMEVFMTYLL